MLGKMHGNSKPTLILNISASSTTPVNVRTALGSPATVNDVIVNVASGVIQGSNSFLTPSLRWGTGWPVGTTFTLNNSGSIVGIGGAGANGTRNSNPAATAGDGGPAMDLDGNAVNINNGSGLLGGGGGGGAGGPGDPAGTGISEASGGGGGGGRGSGNSGAGSAGPTGGVSGGAGSAGTTSGAGGGGSGSTNSTYGTTGFSGAGGGDYGADGGDNFRNPFTSSGGNAGKAINLNGGTATFLSGNNPSQVKGAVS
jgi:hypothetical protein